MKRGVRRLPAVEMFRCGSRDLEFFLQPEKSIPLLLSAVIAVKGTSVNNGWVRAGALPDVHCGLITVRVEGIQIGDSRFHVG